MSNNLIKLSKREKASVLVAFKRREVKPLECSIFNASAFTIFEYNDSVYELEELFEKIVSLKRYGKYNKK